MTPEAAFQAARDRAAPIVEIVRGKINDALGSAEFDGVGPVKVELPKKMRSRKGLMDLHRFIVDDAVAAYTKLTETGSRWGVVVDTEERTTKVKSEADPTLFVEQMETFYLLTFTPHFPPSPNPADH